MPRPLYPNFFTKE
nr:unnamed protein product [Callosobruchus chinensis]CAH7759166.1 unnamed protein product [Callosobruchus chinensis]